MATTKPSAAGIGPIGYCDRKFNGLLAQIADAFGPEVATTIQDHYGGTRISIPAPNHLAADHWLAALVGFELAKKIASYFAVKYERGYSGVRHEVIPMGRFSALSAARRLALLYMQDGRNVRETARLVGVHERSVFRWRKAFVAQGHDIPNRYSAVTLDESCVNAARAAINAGTTNRDDIAIAAGRARSTIEDWFKKGLLP